MKQNKKFNEGLFYSFVFLCTKDFQRKFQINASISDSLFHTYFSVIIGTLIIFQFCLGLSNLVPGVDAYFPTFA